jgi:hypothetical protein
LPPRTASKSLASDGVGSCRIEAARSESCRVRKSERGMERIESLLDPGRRPGSDPPGAGSVTCAVSLLLSPLKHGTERAPRSEARSSAPGTRCARIHPPFFAARGLLPRPRIS